MKGVILVNCSFNKELRPPAWGNQKRGVGRFLSEKDRGEKGKDPLDNEGVSPNESEPDSASLHVIGGGQPAGYGEA